MLTDDHIYYPEGVAPDVVVSKIRAVLAQSDEALLLDPLLDLDNFIHRVCWTYGVHPIWVLLSLQREQSLIADNDSPATERAWSRATGVVGQHTPGQANKLWDGLPNQILLSARSAAWLAGIGPNENFGYRSGLWPSAERWTKQNADLCQKRVALLHPDGSFHKWFMCQSVAQYVQYGYTPSEPVLQQNADILNLYILKHF